MSGRTAWEVRNMARIRHSERCRDFRPDCLCLSCGNDRERDGKACCALRQKWCAGGCDDYIDEREVSGDGLEDRG